MASSTALSRIEDLAAQTPADRNRHVDFLRVAAIGMVVVGHWLAVAIRTSDGQLEGVTVLAEVDWTHWVTWAFQVMPVFFLVGGYANAASWTSHRDRGGDWASWIHRRASRLLWPTTTFLGFGAAAAVAARSAGISPEVLDEATWFLVIMIWFLAVYLGVTALAPALLAGQARWGWGLLATMAAVLVTADVARMGFDVDWVANVNFLFVWGGVHVLGLAWWDGRLVRSERRLWALGLSGAVLLVVLTVSGPYPVSMINVPGAPVQNTNPPTVALAALASAQTGGLLLLRRPAQRWLERSSRAWTIVVGGNAVIMTVFLWHVVPVLLAAPLLHLTGLWPQAPVGSGAWLALRIPWVLLLALLLVVVVAVLGRFEQPPAVLRIDDGAGRTGAATALATSGVAATVVAIVLLTDRGLFVPGGPVGLPLGALALYVAGVVALHGAGRHARWPRGRP